VRRLTFLKFENFFNQLLISDNHINISSYSMRRYYTIILLLFIIFALSDRYGIVRGFSLQYNEKVSCQDTIKENQVLYNGRIWRNLFYMVQGDQFLFSKEFLSGSLSISGKTFSDILLKYDILKDEILTPSDSGGVLQVNKELVDSFSVSFQNKTYHFIKMQEDSLKGSKRYINVLYKGKTALYLEYNKKIEKLAAEGKYDKFYQINHIYFVKGNIFYPITSKSDLLKVFANDKALIKNFIKKNKLYVSEKMPDSFIPVMQYYDNISK